MPNPPLQLAASHLRSVQILVAALALGIVIFAGIAFQVAPIGDPMPPVVMGLDVLALAALAATITMVPMAFFLPGHFVGAASEADEDQRIAVFRTSRVTGAALVEGPALLWCVGLLLSGTTWYLAPIALLVGLLVIKIPTRDAFENATGVRITDS